MRSERGKARRKRRKRSTRKWPGLGPNVFIVDYGALFEDFKEFKDDEEDAQEANAAPT